MWNFILKTWQLRICCGCGNTWESINMFPLQSQISKHTFKILLWGWCGCFMLRGYQVVLVKFIFNFLTIRNIYSQNFYNFFSQVDIFHTTECHITFFRFPIPAISRLSMLGRSPEGFRKGSISFKAFFTEVCFYKKNVVSSA